MLFNLFIYYFTSVFKTAVILLLILTSCGSQWRSVSMHGQLYYRVQQCSEVRCELTAIIVAARPLAGWQEVHLLATMPDRVIEIQSLVLNDNSHTYSGRATDGQYYTVSFEPLMPSSSQIYLGSLCTNITISNLNICH